MNTRLFRLGSGCLMVLTGIVAGDIEARLNDVAQEA
jgi:hypothetical protein